MALDEVFNAGYVDKSDVIDVSVERLSRRYRYGSLKDESQSPSRPFTVITTGNPLLEGQSKKGYRVQWPFSSPVPEKKS